MTPRPVALPRATYRVQLHRGFPLADLEGFLGYFDALGISHLYLSPLGRARAGSTHGYDIVDPTVLNPEIGTEEDLARLAARCRDRGMGLVVDVVPNHMYIAAPENAWWNDVLENGPSSPFARYFDIDWNPPKPDLEDKVLLPILGDQYGRVLERKQIQIERQDGTFHVRYLDHVFPLAPKTWVSFLGSVAERLARQRGDEAPSVLELHSILTALGHLPSRSERDPVKVRERQREKEIVKGRLATLFDDDPDCALEVDRELGSLNGNPEDPRSFDRLEALLAEQAYRLSFWRVASDEINYRRFFDVNELAAIRVEDPEVAEAVHRLAFRWIAENKVEGLRIDHVDGLYDPLDYLRRLPPDVFVVVEKILVGDEKLPESWPVQGTTGYEFLNLLNGFFVDPSSQGSFLRLYRRLGREGRRFREVVYESKKLVLQVALSAELTVLSRKLDRISERYRYSRDFTLRNLHDSLAQVIACFPVYRTYVRSGEPPSETDRTIVARAVREAKKRNPSTSESVFDFIGSVLLSEDPESTAFAASFQQLTGPVMAKGLEDTALYRYYPLASLAEVGGDPERFGIGIDAFHEASLERVSTWPHALSPTSTHDTKRDEDVRSRLNVLSEIPERWEEALARFRELNQGRREAEGDLGEDEAPDGNEEYLFYQTLVGIWPGSRRGGGDEERLGERVRAYMRKALKEAKLHTSWVNPRESYEGAVDRWVCRVLDSSRGNPFLADLDAFVDSIAKAGHLNAVSQTLLKIASPGVPDFYQGTEIPELRLVDPDDRTPVDYGVRQRALAEIAERARVEGEPALARRLLDHPEDGRLKLFVTQAALGFRRANPELFAEGDYLPLAARGRRRNHVIAFARRKGESAALTVVSRFFTSLPSPPIGAAAWEETSLEVEALAGARFRCVLTGVEVERQGPALPLDRVLAGLPIALLERVG